MTCPPLGGVGNDGTMVTTSDPGAAVSADVQVVLPPEAEAAAGLLCAVGEPPDLGW
jgi:hypothetical protein